MDTAFFFESYYENAEVNSILIMDSDGVVLDVNQSFTNNFGYTDEEIRGKNFSILFNESDKAKNKPLLELKTVLNKGQAHDENYIVNKHGQPIWCTGESLLINGKQGEKYIVKDVINLQAKKQLQLFLTETEELLERIFRTSNDVPMIEVDGSLKIQKVNKAFLELFEIEHIPVTGSRLSDLNHSFWNSTEIKKSLSKTIINNEPMKSIDFMLSLKSGEEKTVRLHSKIIDSQSGSGRKIFIIIEDVTMDLATGLKNLNSHPVSSFRCTCLYCFSCLVS